MLDFFVDYKTAFIVVHLLGVAIALCGAVLRYQTTLFPFLRGLAPLPDVQGVLD
jgi:hypothetical protein